METKKVDLINKIKDYNDDNCGCCNRKTDYSTCYCCTLCWKLICPNCVKIFGKGWIYPDPSGYTVCNSNCFIIHNILNNMFNKSIALYIASFQPYNIKL